jgi:hypothetical protein
MNRPLLFSQILQEVTVAKSLRECFDVLWRYKDYIEALATPMREYLFELIQDAVEQRGWMAPFNSE